MLCICRLATVFRPGVPEGHVQFFKFFLQRVESAWGSNLLKMCVVKGKRPTFIQRSIFNIHCLLRVLSGSCKLENRNPSFWVLLRNACLVSCLSAVHFLVVSPSWMLGDT